MDKTLRDLADEQGLLIGACFNPHAFNTDPLYGETLAREFNCLVAENVMKMHQTQPEAGRFTFDEADGMLAFAEQNRMQVRGHTFVWHNGLPEWVQAREFSRTEALDVLREHIFSVADHFKGKIFAWDVVNEAFSDAKSGWREDTPWGRAIGPDYMETVFKWAHEADPGTLLFYNDYGMEEPNAKADTCYTWAKEMLDKGVPLHGVGLQYHTKLDEKPDPSKVADNIARFNALGLTVHITELDIWLKGEPDQAMLEAQGEAYAEVIRTALEAADCAAVLLWGFTDKYSWIPNFTKNEYGHSLVFNEDFKAKKGFTAMCRELAE